MITREVAQFLEDRVKEAKTKAEKRGYCKGGRQVIDDIESLVCEMVRTFLSVFREDYDDDDDGLDGNDGNGNNGNNDGNKETVHEGTYYGRSRRSPFLWSQIDTLGCEFSFRYRPDIRFIAVGNRECLFNGKKYTLRRLTNEISQLFFNDTRNRNASRCWTHNGQLLDDYIKKAFGHPYKKMGSAAKIQMPPRENESRNDEPNSEENTGTNKKVHRVPFSWQTLGIPEGAMIEFKHDSRITFITKDDRTCLYKGTEYSIQKLTQKLCMEHLNKVTNYAYTHWRYNGVSLDTFYKKAFGRYGK